jgi:hypothetical protein
MSEASIPPTGSTVASGAEDLLVLVDMQRDFLAADGRFAGIGLIDPERTAALAERVSELLSAWRTARRPVAFIRTVVDEAALPSVVLERNQKNGRAGWLQPGSRGADFFGVLPEPSEAVFSKTIYDPFLNPQFEGFLAGTRPVRLVLAGSFTDVCIDALARTAYQKGYRVVVVEDATLPLRREQSESLDFMRTFYGIETVTVADAVPRL